MRAASLCGCLLLAVAIYAMDVSSDVNADEVASISEDHASGNAAVLGLKTADPTDCKTVKKTLPSLCAVFGEEHCGAMKAKMLANCKDVEEEDDHQELIESDESRDVADMSAPANDDVGEGVGRRGGALMTSGSFTMMSSSGLGLTEEDLGEDDDEEEKAQDWDIHNGGKCKQGEEAWMPTDAEDKTLGHCVEFAADTKCGAQCFHKGQSVDDTIDGAVCSKICRVPGANGAQCNVIKTVQPMKEESQGLGEGKTMYLTRSKVMQAGLKLDDLSNADPMACAGVATNRRA
jgi:hypothetical protein